MDTATDLKTRLKKLKEKIEDTKKRLPAHSIKPPIMMELLALEDEYEDLLAQLSDVSTNNEEIP